VSADRLVLEELLRDEEKRASRMRAEQRVHVQPVPPRQPALRVRRKRPPTHHLVMVADTRAVCASYVRRWWQRRRSSLRANTPVSSNEIRRLVESLRRLEGG
jgi:hypothetical protein